MLEFESMETATTVTNNGHEYASKSRTDTALGFGIAGTALGVLNALGTGWLGTKMTNGSSTNNNSNGNGGISQEEAYIERSMAAEELARQKEYYEGRLVSQKSLADAFFDAYQRDIDNSFMLYKNQRDMNDAITKESHDNYDKLKQMNIDNSFMLYKNQRDEKDNIMAAIYTNNSNVNDKINKLQSQVDVMAAIRPYQDALINAKIDKNAILADYNLSRRTCRMIEGQLVLPDNLVSGFTSYNSFNVQ